MRARRSVRNLSCTQEHDILRVLLEGYYYDHLNFQALSEKSGVSKSTVFRWIRNFEAENPQMCEQMKKQGKAVTPEDYKKILRENMELRKLLSQEKLRADFYEEMVAFGKEVYGIDLKKAGTK